MKQVKSFEMFLVKQILAKTLALMIAFVIGMASPLVVHAQSSSLYMTSTSAPVRPVRRPSGRMDRLSPKIASFSFSAVPLPAMRKFAVHDLITIIIRESIENDSIANFEATKEVKFKDEIKAFPNLRLGQIFQGAINGGKLTAGPKVDLRAINEFAGDGQKSRKDTFTTRITATIIDIKPNGTMVLEARKRIHTDKEKVSLVMTGICRKEDITANNTILSTQLSDLSLIKDTRGDVRKAVEKGVLTRVLDTIFNF